jgi:FKBP-type peptidyl-prolyl cis-trans isomerase (trigger factor)
MEKKYKVLEKSEAKNSIINLLVEIEKDFLASFRGSSIMDLGEELEIDGFRKGHAPEKFIIEKVGELKILEKNLFKAINTLLPVILQEEKINALTMPNISITKLAENINPELKIEVTLFPEVEVCDYKKIAKEVEKIKDTEATETEVDEYIKHIRENKKQIDKSEDLPELNDDFVKSLGEFKNVEDFKKQIKENISKDKKLNAEQKRRVDIIEKIINESKVDVPQILIEEEQEKMLHEFRGRVESFKMNFEEYLKEIKKTESELKDEWKKDAEKRTKMNLILPKIAQLENIKPDMEEVNHEVKHLKEHHKDADEQVLKIYVANVLTNQKVFDYLENLE